MPRTKLGEQFKPKPIIRLIDIPDLPLVLSMEKAADLAGVGRQYIKSLADEGKIVSIASGAKRVVPTWNFLITMQLFPESLLEKIYMQRLENKQSA